MVRFAKKLLLLAVIALTVAGCRPAPVELNSANRRDLESVKEIGPRMAELIIRERKRNGDFKSWEDFIARMKGVGPKSAAQMSADGLIINGQALPEAAPK